VSTRIVETRLVVYGEVCLSTCRTPYQFPYRIDGVGLHFRMPPPTSHKRTITDFFSKSTAPPPKPSNAPSTAPAQSSLIPKQSMPDPPSSSLPRSSDKSKRGMYKGMEFVRGSSDDDDSDAPLPDLDELLKVNRSKLPPKPKPIPEGIRFRPKQTKDINRAETMIQDLQRDQERQRRIESLETKLREDGTASYLSNGTGIEASEETLKAVYRTDGEEGDAKAKKVLEAMQRTEALKYEHVFHYFDTSSAYQNPKFPKESLPRDFWAKQLDNETQRDSAFRSGFVSRIATLRPLPQELLQWILDQICFETRQDLLLAYLDTLESSTTKFSNPLNDVVVRRLLLNLGARNNALDCVTISSERALIVDHSREISPNVRYFLDLIFRISPTIASSTSLYLLQQLTTITMDHTIYHNPTLSTLLIQAITSLITHLPTDPTEPYLSTLISSIYDAVKDPALRATLISHLPLCPIRTHTFRRRLALAFSLSNLERALPPVPLDNPALTAHIVISLRDAPEYDTLAKSFDYADLVSNLRVLDVAISNGFISLPSNPTPEQVNAHDMGIDELVQAITELSHSIVGTGAAHMSRLEARAAAERISQRLDLGVRRKGRRPKDWYKEGAGVMKGWMSGVGDVTATQKLNNKVIPAAQEGASEEESDESEPNADD
jgi:hypothetical protein